MQVDTIELSRANVRSASGRALEPTQAHLVRFGLGAPGDTSSDVLERDGGDRADRTTRAVERQLRALGGDDLEIGLRSVAAGILIERSKGAGRPPRSSPLFPGSST